MQSASATVDAQHLRLMYWQKRARCNVCWQVRDLEQRLSSTAAATTRAEQEQERRQAVRAAVTLCSTRSWVLTGGMLRHSGLTARHDRNTEPTLLCRRTRCDVHKQTSSHAFPCRLVGLVWQAADKAIAAAQQGQAESAAELERFKERSDAIQRRVAATGSVLQQVLVQRPS